MSKPTLGYLEPEATFSHAMASQYANGKFDLVGFKSIVECLMALCNGEVDQVIVPAENDSGREVLDTINFLMGHAWHSGLRIIAEDYLHIKQALLGLPGTVLDDVTHVMSKDQGFNQCREFLGQHSWEQIAQASTAEAARFVAKGGDKTVVAIAPAIAAEKYNLEVLDPNISDSRTSVTRFIVLGGVMPKKNGKDKTTIFFTTEDTTDALLNVLELFRGISLAKIQSWPDREGGFGECIFWLDVEAHQQEQGLQEVILKLRGITTWFAILGSYPKAALPTFEEG